MGAGSWGWIGVGSRPKECGCVGEPHALTEQHAGLVVVCDVYIPEWTSSGKPHPHPAILHHCPVHLDMECGTIFLKVQTA